MAFPSPLGAGNGSGGLVQLPLHGAHNAGISPVQLGVLALLHAQLRLVRLEQRDEVGVLKDVEIAE